jgi:hypothetical protein
LGASSLGASFISEVADLPKSVLPIVAKAVAVPAVFINPLREIFDSVADLLMDASINHANSLTQTTVPISSFITPFVTRRKPR